MLKKLIDKPIAVSMSLIAIMLLGAVASNLLPVSLVPDVAIPQITVQVNSPNTTARELDESVMKLLRQQLIQVGHLTDIRTDTKDGSGNIAMQFEHGSDVDYLFVEVNEKIDRTMSALPRDLERPKVIKSSATDIPAFYINMTLRDETAFVPESDLFPVSSRFVELSSFAGQVIAKRIEQLPEVAMVDLSGVVHPELLIIPNPEKLQLLNITYYELERVLNAANVKLGNLTIRDGEYRYNVRFQSQLSGRTDIENLYLKLHDRVYQLKELAQVVEHPQKRTGLVRSNGQDAISLAVIKQSDAKMASLKESINKLLGEFETDYPDITFTSTRDQTELLDYSINNLIQNIIIGGVLACLIIFLFMQDFRSPLLVVLTIPTALVLSLLFFFLVGLTINIISLSGLILGVGMMVDNSIIVIDNITRRWSHGEPLRKAVVEGTQEVFAPMLSSILTTCSVFVPLIFMSGISGALFYDQAMAVTITLFSSLIATMTIIPVFYYLAYRRKSHFTPNRLLERVSFDRLFYYYDEILKWFFRRRYIMWTVFGIAAVGIVIIFQFIDKERLPPLAHNDTLLSIEWNERISAEENSRRTEQLLGTLSEVSESNTVMAGVQQFVLSHTPENSISEAVVYIQSEKPSQVQQVEERVRDYMTAHHPEAVYGFGASGNIFEMIFSDKEAKLTARIRPTNGKAPEPTSLNLLLGEIAEQIPDLTLQPVAWQEHILYVAQPEMMSLYGIDYAQLLQHLRNSLNENRLFTIVQGQFSVPVIMGDNTQGVADILAQTIRNRDSVEIPLMRLMRETQSRDLKSITSGSEGDFYPLDLEVNDKQVPQVMKQIRQVVAQNPDFEVSFSGSYFSNREMIGELILILVVSIALLYFILSAQFESLVQPIVILSEIVIDLFGALFVLWICGVSLNLMSLIGIIVMCGIVINDSILKIDTINRLRKEGMSLIRAIFEAGRRRLKPILMTSLTTILAVAPFLAGGDMGSDLQYPLSLTLIGGMIIGTLVSIFFVPLAYYATYKRKKK